MKICNTNLLKFLEAIDSNLLGLIMQLIALSKAIATRFSTDFQHYPKILRHLSNSVRGQLMQLYMKFESISMKVG
jgi:hypothetical protein